jgi:hypothetical protein
MMPHPELTRYLAKEHQHDMITDAERQRLLNSARRHRRRMPLRRHQ